MRYLNIFFVLLLIGTSCKKDEPIWEWCNDCAKEELIGIYMGEATINSYQGEEEPWLKKENQEITVRITENNTNLVINVAVVNEINRNYTVEYTGAYYLNYLLGFNATIWKSVDQLKLVGTVKSSNEIMIYQIIDFEVFKIRAEE